MQDIPPHKPPVVNYQTPDPAPRNTPGKFFGRMAIGIGLGIGGCILGSVAYAIAATTLSRTTPSAGTTLLVFLIAASPIVLALILAINIGLRQRKYGYVTGVILAPFIIVVCLFLLLLAICGSSAFR